MLFDKFINREPLDHKVLGDLALELGEYDKALNHYKKEEYNYFNTEDDNYINMDDIGGTYLIEEIYEKIIEIYLRRDDYENAIKYSKKIVENDESREYVNKGSSVIELSKLYVLNGQNKTAVDTLEDLLDYELNQIELNPDENYPKKLYMAVCYELINILKNEDKSKSQKYLDFAMDMYHKNSKSDLGSEMADIINLQSEFYKESLIDHNLSKDDLNIVEQICRNCVLASEIYIKEYEEEKAINSIEEGVELYDEFNLDNFKLQFDLIYQLANVKGEIYADKEDIYNDYLNAYEILKQNNFFDEYKKNMILDQLYYYCDDFELSDNYRSQCDYYYIAEYNIKHSEKWIVSSVSEYEKAADNYNACHNYDMAIKCYKKALDNLSGYGLFTGEFYEEEENLDMWDRISISYSKYNGLCKSISRAYDDKKDYDEAIKYLNMEIDCINKHRDSSDFKSDKYYSFAYIYQDIAELLNKKSDFKNSIKYYLFVIGVCNSPNLDNSISDKYDDIEFLLKLLEEDKINEYILSEEFTIELDNQYMNRMQNLFENLLKVAEKASDEEVAVFCKQKLNLIKDTPFDI